MHEVLQAAGHGPFDTPLSHCSPLSTRPLPQTAPAEEFTVTVQFPLRPPLVTVIVLVPDVEQLPVILVAVDEVTVHSGGPNHVYVPDPAPPDAVTVVFCPMFIGFGEAPQDGAPGEGGGVTVTLHNACAPSASVTATLYDPAVAYDVLKLAGIDGLDPVLGLPPGALHV